jgi:hypothetical protein
LTMLGVMVISTWARVPPAKSPIKSQGRM